MKKKVQFLREDMSIHYIYYTKTYQADYFETEFQIVMNKKVLLIFCENELILAFRLNAISSRNQMKR